MKNSHNIDWLTKIETSNVNISHDPQIPFIALQGGAVEFMKIPVWVPEPYDVNFTKKVELPQIRGERRPLGCWEPAPEGTEFYLVSRIGKVWEEHYPPFRYDEFNHSYNEAEWLDNLNENLSTAIFTSAPNWCNRFSDDVMDGDIVGLYRVALGKAHEANNQAKAESIAGQIGWIAGYRAAARLLGRVNPTKGQEDELNEIFSFALYRHWDCGKPPGPLELAEILGGERVSPKESESDWSFENGSRVLTHRQIQNAWKAGKSYLEKKGKP